MEGFSFVTPVTGLNRPNTGKEDDDEKRGTGIDFPCQYHSTMALHSHISSMG
jgi:hypothetical protein